MILSMTGFGEAEVQADGVRYHVEIRSVNNRYFKSAIKLPEQLQPLEVDVDRLLRTKLGRGSVTFVLRVKDENATAACEINAAVLTRYLSRLEQVAEGRAAARIDLASLLDAPGVCEQPNANRDLLAEQFKAIQQAAGVAIDKLVEMRRVEGEALLRDISSQCDLIRRRLDDIRRRSPAVVEDFRKRLHARIQQMMAESSVELDHDALVREVAIFAERCDVNEEASRICSHLDQFGELCEGSEEAGRKLDFLAQEMLREANTIGSKASDAEITRHVVEIKAAIDRIKEQVQNVE
ncbi:MAG TPA: YicC/YloC family endoribonuclease [Phycisphaerae bacterium]|nr:YicC/YloC family endoribonuclease [Phycisphaerae bacterium]